ncbi:MAG: L,D-transpeptidase family protein [Gemmatimonadota bacterium]
MKISIRRLSLAATIVLVAAGAGVSYAGPEPLPADDSDLQLVLNVAGNRLYVIEDGERTRTYKVSVGMRGYETPAGDYRIREVIWNPWWHPPDSEWARGRVPEPPGPANPMGRVKLNFAPLLYIHGTVDTQALGEPASRGCVRMRNEDLIELTRLVHEYSSPKVSEDVLDELAASPTDTRTVRLQRPVRFTAVYEVAAVDEGFLIIYPDVYGLVKEQVREEVEAVLQEYGINPDTVDRATLDRLVQKSGSRRVAIALDDLRAGASGMTPQIAADDAQR